MYNNLVLDTNILLNQMKDEGIVLYGVLCELDKLKMLDNETGYKARRAIREIQKNPRLKTEYFEVFKEEAIDDYLIRFCDGTYTLATMDLSLSLKARTKNVDVEFIAVGKNFDYDPFLRHYRDKGQCKDISDETFIIDSGQIYAIKNEAPKYISRPQTLELNIDGLNPEQDVLIYSLRNSKKPVFVVIGVPGSGKSFLLTKYALNQLEQNQIEKIVMVGNNADVKDTRNIGALPGDIFEKEVMYCSPILNILPMKDLRNMWEQQKIEIVPMSLMRGRDFKNSIIYVSEAQNLTTDHIKLLLGRVGENSKIFFDGDIRQVDNDKFKEYSGLRTLANLHNSGKDNNLINFIRLEQGVRSKAATLADIIDKENL